MIGTDLFKAPLGFVNFVFAMRFILIGLFIVFFIALLALSFVCSLGMGYLSSQDFAEASMNWIAEGVNVVGQGTLLISVILLDKNGLAELKLKGDSA